MTSRGREWAEGAPHRIALVSGNRNRCRESEVRVPLLDRAGVTIPMVALLLCRCESVNASVLNKLPHTAELHIPCGLNQLEL